MNKLELWDNLECDLINLYKSDELTKVDPILADKLQSISQAYYSNIAYGDLNIFIDKVRSVNYIVNENYFNSRYYDKDLKEKVERILNELNLLSICIKKDLSSVYTREHKDSDRFPNIDNDKVKEMYNYGK